MTERLYYDDSSRLEFDAVIVAVECDDTRYVTVLDRSAFYPTSGGQQHDTGELGGIPVMDVIEVDNERVGHVTARPVGNPGERVDGRIDAARRRRHCRQHTAQHVLSQVFVSLFGHETVSVHLGEEYGAIELDVDGLSEERLQRAEDRANEIVLENRPVTQTRLSREEAGELPLRKAPPDKAKVRVVSIDGLDWSACGGTHCKSTAEIGLIKIAGAEKMRGHVLVRFLCGKQALRDYAERYRLTDELSRRLTCNIGDLPSKLESLDNQTRDLRRELSVAWRQLLPIRAERAVARASSDANRNVCIVEEDVPDQKLAGELAGLVADRVKMITLLSYDGRLLLATPSDSQLHAGDLARRLAGETGLRGGGSARLAQLGGLDVTRMNDYRDAVERLIQDD